MFPSPSKPARSHGTCIFGFNDMTDDKIVALVRENERMRAALEQIQSYAYNASFGGWRQPVFDLATNGLKRPS